MASDSGSTPPRKTTVDESLRRRRPSGEPAPLPKDPLAGSGKTWVALAIVVTLVLGLALSTANFFLGSGKWWNDFDAAITDAFVAARASLVTDIAKVLKEIGNDWVITGLRWASVIALVAVKRWRHLMVFVAVILVTELLVVGLANRLARPRPDGVEILTDWSGFAQPSLDVAALTVTLVAVVYAFVVPGRIRQKALLWTTAVIALVGLSRIYLGVDRVTDGASAVVIGVTLPLVAFRLITPDAVFPVSYRKGKTAHLELGAERRNGIIMALRNQLGIDAIDIELFGLEGSGGSTPLRISVAGGGHVFGKIYAKNHLRSDRWYKIGRTLLYGALEDEAPFRTVRRLAEHEDHLMRLMEEAGVPAPRPLGIAEITPGREYLIVTEFIEGAQELSDAEIGAETIDDAMWTVNKMWDLGLAHRDVKPANILVGSGQVYLIDHAFGEIRPSPWREAIDLANMMLALSMHFPPEVVYERASEHFSQDELAEAFAATRGVTIPGELRSALKNADGDRLAEFRALAPPTPPIRIQRWTRRRIMVFAVLLGSAAAALWLVALNLRIVGTLL
jgi:tRNA A-37 threonylcarbamoyl transferase component Bud32/membrane-associated phospholipid phosphatase